MGHAYRTRTLQGFALAVVVCATGCTGALTPSQARGERSELNVGRGRWATRGFSDYRYRFQYLCFCPASLVTAVEIQVRDGRVVAVLDPATGRPASAVAGRPTPTVPELFGIVESALDRGVDWIDVQYDLVLGYPAVIRIDANTRTVDEEQSYFAGSLAHLD